MEKSIFVLLVLAALALSQPSIPGNRRSTGRTTQFRNGRRFNVDALVRELRNRQQSITANLTDANRFSRADQGVRNDGAESNFRSFFSQSEGNEFVNSSAASNAAMMDTRQLETLVNSTGINTTQSFDADGNPVDQGIAEISAGRGSDCPFDRPNALPCESSFREPTARCTNLMNGRKTWGMAGTAFTRVLPAFYEDGISERRKTGAVSGSPLKSPREISTTVTTTNVVLNFNGFSAQIMQWGQFIAHEFTHLSQLEADAACCPDQIFAARNGKDVTPTSAQLDLIRAEVEQFRGDVCMQVELDNDPVYGRYVCMLQTRSRPAPLHDCAIAPRQQMNSVSHVFDASAVYGSSKSEQDSLRSFTGGRMKTQTVNGRVLPPQDLVECPVEKRNANRCPFLGGDTRINTTPNLVSTHAATLIKHNQIADNLTAINPHWDDERTFQETRRIMAGIEANIHYYEYLPLILGSRILNKYNLQSYTGFDPDVNPSIVSELAHAAFRFGHSTVNGRFLTVKDNGTEKRESLTEKFFNHDFVYNDGVQQCARGLQKDILWFVDRNFPSDMRDTLFNDEKDIVSLNINRGRDHGLSSYVAYRNHYNLSVPKSFDDLNTTHPAEVIASLRRVYERVEDVELYIAGVTEFPVDGGLIGELFANIIGDGFSRVRNGDRLFFESPHSGLTPSQIRAIRNYKYHQLLCESHELENITNNAFVTPGNTVVSQRLGVHEVACASFPPLDLSLWKEVLNQPMCEWKITSTSECCLGEREITRMCSGSAGCQCPGQPKIRERCTCKGFQCYLNLDKKCAFRWGFSSRG